MDPLDARSVANAIISLANAEELPVTQLSLQKIIYFVHGRYLAETGTPLVMGHFEAWPYGPVHPLIYNSFKSFGDKKITSFATIKDLMSGEVESVDPPTDRFIRRFIRDTTLRYLDLSPGRLVDLSHAPRSPWDVVTLKPDGKRAFGSRISNDLIRDLFKFHKVSVGVTPRAGEPNEESPPTGD